MNIDGAIHTFGAVSIVSIWPAIMLPHDEFGFGTLRPNSARPPSITMTIAIPSSAIDSIAGSTLGNTSRSITRIDFAPWARDAITNSRCDHASVFALVIRPSTGTDTMPIATTITPMRPPYVGGCWSVFGDSTDTSVSARTSAWNARRMLKIAL